MQIVHVSNTDGRAMFYSLEQARRWAHIQLPVSDEAIILLRRGDIFSERVEGWKRGNVTLGAYGDENAPLPVIKSPIFIHNSGEYSNWTIRNLKIVFEGFAAKAVVHYASAGNNLLFENLVLVGGYTGLIVAPYPQADKKINNVIFRNSRVFDSGGFRGHGVFASDIKGLLISGNFVDKCGQVGSPQSHAYYIQTGCEDVEFIDNVSTRCFADGGQIRSGGTIKRNVILRCPIGLDIGAVRGKSEPTAGGIVADVSNNIVLYCNDIDEKQPRGTGLLFGNMKHLTLRNNIIGYPRTSLLKAAMGIKFTDIGVGLKALDSSGNVVAGYEDENKAGGPAALPVNLAFARVDHVDVDNWANEAREKWLQEPPYSSEGLRDLVSDPAPEKPAITGIKLYRALTRKQLELKLVRLEEEITALKECLQRWIND